MPDLPLPAGYSRVVNRGDTCFLLDRCRSSLLDFFSTPLDAWRTHPAAKTYAGKGLHFSVPLPGGLGRGFVRCWTRGGGARWLGRWFGGFRRPLDELRAMVRARELGVPVPEPLAIATEKVPFGYHLATLSREVESAGDFPAVLGAFAGPDESARTALRRTLADRLGKAVGRLHRAGIYPMDLHLRNVLVTHPDVKPDICLVDLDPLRSIPDTAEGGAGAPARRELAAASLGRLFRSARRWTLARLRIDPADYGRFARAYARGADLDRRAARDLFRAATRAGLRGRALRKDGGRDARGVTVLRGAGAPPTLPIPHRILFKMPNWLGDVVMAIPLLEGTRRLWPNAAFAVLTEDNLKDVYELLPEPLEVIACDRGSASAALDSVRRREFDLIVTIPRSLGAACLSRRCGGSIRVGFDGPLRRWFYTHRTHTNETSVGRHRVERYWTLGASLGLGPFPPAPRLRVPPSRLSEADERLSQRGVRAGDTLIGINPGAAYGPAKQWPAERFIETAKALSWWRGVRLLLFGSAAEAPIAEAIARETDPAAVSFAGATTLPQLAALIARCRVFLTNDTGPMHLAAALGVPVVAIFGSTDPVATGPYGPGHRVVHAPTPCAPCLRRRCPTDFRCMTSIDPEAVIQAIEAALGNSGVGTRTLEGRIPETR
jgi:heptosyltransferase-2